MRVLILNQIFWPDRAGSARLATDLARFLGENGVEVSVVAGPARNCEETQEAPPVQILRAPDLFRGRGSASRTLSFGSYLGAALFYALFGPKADLIVTLTTPPLLSIVGVIAKILRGCRHHIWEMDLYPQVAIDVGMLRAEAPLTRLLLGIANWARRRADGVIVIGECMRNRLEAGGMPGERLAVAENWGDGELLTPAPLPLGAITVLYAGNLGRVHDTQTVAEAMEQLHHDARIRFLFVGGGPARPAVEEFCRTHGITHATFEAYRRSDAVPALLAASHIGLVTLRSECLGSSVPSKLYEFMAAGRSVLFIGPAESTTAKTIARHLCGWHVEPGDVAALVSTLQLIASNPDLLRTAGANGRRAFVADYDLPARVCHLAGILGLHPQPQDGEAEATALTALGSRPNHNLALSDIRTRNA